MQLANDRGLKSITHSGVGRSYSFTSNPYQITAMTDTASAGHPWSSQTKVFSYDGADRLLLPTATVTGNSSFDYDRLDNLTRRSDAGGTITPTYNGLNQVLGVSGQSWSYGVAGNLLSDGWRNYQWDGSNRLTQVTFAGNANRMNYAYDGLGRRVKGIFTSNGTTTETRYLWCGLRLCQMRDGQDNVTTRLYQEGEYRTAGAQKYVYLTDHLGSVRDVVDATSGALLGSLDYSPYGQVQRQSGSVSPVYQFAQLPWDGNVGLSFSPTRLYDPQVGRWISRDPIEELGGINLYGYVGGSPTLGVDPLGLQFSRNENPVGKIIETVVGGIVQGIVQGIGSAINNFPSIPNVFPASTGSQSGASPSSSPTARPTSGSPSSCKIPRKWGVPKRVTDLFPRGWTSKPNNKGIGTRWQDPKNPNNGVRVDQGNPNSGFPSQQVDHVVVNSNGKIIGRDGMPIQGSIRSNPEQAHIPLSEYQNWKSWNSP